MTSFLAAGAGLTMAGPAGVLIPLGIETVVSNPSLVTLYYNYFALFGIFLLGIMASQRDSKFISFILPVWGGVCVFAGWLKFPDAGAGFSILVVLVVLSIINYMQDTRHERFGIAGPGSIIIKLFTFMIILQCVVVFVNSSSIFPTGTQPIAQSDQKYANIDLQQNVGQISGTGGLYSVVQNIVTIATEIGISSLVLLGECAVSVGAFSFVLSQIFPWILQAGAIGAAFLVILQFAIWTLYVLFWFTMTYRPSPDPGF